MVLRGKRQELYVMWGPKSHGPVRPYVANREDDLLIFLTINIRG
jgi:hypothetical protein